jgi:predicted Zn-dependent peptidase
MRVNYSLGGSFGGSFGGLLGAVALSLSLACKPHEDTVEPDPVSVDGPAIGPAAVWPDEAFRSKRPAAKPIADVTIPSIQTFTLDNGLQVYLVQQQTLPTVLMFFEWDLGEIHDPKGKTGTAAICGDVMDEATKHKDKSTFAAAQSDHAVGVGINPGLETTTLGVRALTRELGPALDLTAELLLEPGMRQSDFDRVREQRKAAIEQSKGSAASVAQRLFASLIWGSKHPYGKIETEQMLGTIQLADCNAWVSKLKPGGARLWVVGKIDEASLRVELGERFAKWTGSAPKLTKVGPAKPAAGTIFFVDVPGAAQSQILIGHPGPARNADDYEATTLMAAILGGSFSSRINMNLREDKGWAYGARGGFFYNRGGSYFSAGSSVRPDATGPAVLEIAKEIERMRTTDPTTEELLRERDGALLAMPAEFSTATRTLFSFRGLRLYDLPMDWYVGHQLRLRALDTAAIRTAAEARLQIDGHVVLVAGDGAVMLESLEKIAADKVFGPGGIQYLDTDGNPIARPSFEHPQ